MSTAPSSVRETAYYDLLGVKPDATAAEIRKGYRKAALKCHPDRAGDTEEAKEAFQGLQRAYSALYNVETRRLYDQFGEAGLSDENGDVNAAFARANGARAAPISAEDIEQFATEYRFSDMEREDLVLFFRRFDGDVRLVLDYIPYSEMQDLARFVEILDAFVEEEGEKDGAEYKAARKVLLKRAKGVPPREKGAPGAAAAKKGKKKKKDDMSSLVAQLKARNAARGAQFDNWADGLGTKYAHLDREEKAAKKRAGRNKSSSSSSSSLGASKKITKSSKSSKKSKR